MSTGYILPTVMPDGRSQSERQAQALDRDLTNEEGRSIAQGYKVLGYVQLVRGDWQQRYAEQAQGLPAGIVARAKQALAAEASAKQALHHAVQNAQAWVDQNRPADGKTSADLKDKYTVAQRALELAQEAAAPIVRTLGEVVVIDQQTRATINAYPNERAQVEAQAQALLAQLDAKVSAAQRRRAEVGLS